MLTSILHELKLIVAAIALERPDLFEALVGLGARVDGEVGRVCVKAKSEGLGSMLAFLEAYGVNHKSAVEESKDSKGN